MLNAIENELLTRAGRDTPGGAFFRRFWLPLALSQELPERDAPPKRVRILGEDLLAFRDSAGRVGLVHPRCPHRGADLYFGRNEDGGLRCVYHGWKFDASGRCLEVPNAPPDAPIRERVRIAAYPTREAGDIVWAYLGPAGELPELPQLEFTRVPEAHRIVAKRLQECNWAQSIEGALDTAHLSFLHMPAPAHAATRAAELPMDDRRMLWVRDDPLPRFTIVDHDVGFVVGAARNADGDDLYWRTTQFMLPSHATTPSTLPGETYYGYTWVPIDDVSCWIYTYAWNPDRPIGTEERAKIASGHGVFGEVGADYRPLRNRGNEYLIDRDAQRASSYTGVRGVAEQDAMIQESQGLITDRTQEVLTPTDAAVVRFRRTFLAGVKSLNEGAAPAAARNGAGYLRRSGSWVAPRSVEFAQVMVQRFGEETGRVSR